MTLRRIATRTSGQRHGPITRLVSPIDLGALLKPFVFLDQAPSASFIQAHDVPADGPVTVLLGQYGQAINPIHAPLDANYLWVQLKDGQSWCYQPPATHDVAWAFAHTGTLQTHGEHVHAELAVFEASHTPITFTAWGDCAFLVDSAAQHPYPLVLGPHSVHTSREALH